MENKRGVSTVEIIVSFSIFLAFVLFIFLYLNPIKHDISQSLLANLQAGAENQGTVNLIEIPIIVSGNPSGCFQIPLTPFTLSNGGFSVIDINDNKVTNGISGNSIQIQSSGQRLYRILQSTEIANSASLTGCNNLPSNQYSFSVERDSKIYSYQKLLIMNQSYYTSYTQLKSDLNYPITSDFEIFIQSNSFNITMSKKIPASVQVRVRSFPIQILKNDVKETGTIALYVW